MRRLSVLLALLGIAVAAALVLRADAGAVVGAMLAIGWRGAALLLAIQGGLFCLLGLAWATVQPDLPLALLIWGRMVRDAATVCLPFSPVGGYVLGVRAVVLRGPAWTVAAAGTVADVAAEIVAQTCFALGGAVIVLGSRPGSGLTVPLGIGAGVVLAAALGAAWQRGRIGTVVGGLASRLLGERVNRIGEVGAEVRRLFASRRRFAAAVGLHLCGWIVTGVASWIGLRLLGAPTPLLAVLALEALLDAAVALAFAVPGAIGVQEAGYVGLGGLFGLPAEAALGLSLLRRAREVAWGLPILALWQLQELRRA